MIDIKWGRGTGGREKGMGVGERGHLPFPFLAFFPLSLPFPLHLAQASSGALAREARQRSTMGKKIW